MEYLIADLKGKGMRYLILFVCTLILLLVIIFASLNSATVQLHFYVGTIHIIMSLLLFIAVLIGLIVAWLVLLPGWIKLKTNNRRLRIDNAALEKEIKNLRKIPIQDND